MRSIDNSRALVLSLAAATVSGLAWMGFAHAGDAEQKAVDAIHAGSGWISRDDNLPGKPVTGAFFNYRIFDPKPLIPALPHLKQLRIIGAVDCTITDDALAAFGSFEHLEGLQLEWSNVGHAGGLKGLASAKKLGWISMNMTELTDSGLVDIGKCPELSQLFLGYTRITDSGLKHLAGMPRIQNLNIGQNQQITGSGLADLVKCRSLNVIHMNDNPIPDEALRTLSAMDWLFLLGLDNSKVTDAGVEHLKNLKHLTWLGLNKTAITDEGARHIGAMPALAGVGLEGTRITDAGVQALTRLPEMITLGVGHTRVTDASADHFAKAVRLEILNLNGTAITDRTLKAISKNRRLRELHLEGTKITDAGLAELKDLTDLRLLNLKGTGIGDKGLAALGGDPSNPPLYDQPREYVWIDDETPAGVKLMGDSPWEWVGRDKPVLSGQKAMRRSAKGRSQHFFHEATPGLRVGEGDKVFAYVFMAPNDPPEQIMMQFHTDNWDHRPYWGKNLIPFGPDSPPARVRIGDLPELGKWVRLEVEASKLGMAPGSRITGWSFDQHGGTCYWDKAGIVSRVPQTNRGLDEIEELDLSGTGVTDAGLKTLAAFPRLRRLVLDNTSITNAGLKHLLRHSHLNHLSLSGTQVTDEGLATVGEMAHPLHVLYVKGANITDHGIELLAKSKNRFPDQLDLSDTRITDAALKTMGPAGPNVLMLNHTKITDQGLRELTKRNSLRFLYANGTRVTDAGLETLASWPLLRELKLGDTRITDKGMAHIASMKNLWTLDINNTPVTAAGLKLLEGKHRLRHLDVSLTRASDDAVAALRKNLPHCKIEGP